MPSSTPVFPPPFTVRPATEGDLDRLVDLLWAVAAEGRWLGPEVPFDRAAHRSNLAASVAGPHSVVLVADSGGEAGVVGNLSVNVAHYGVADIGMLLAAGWRGCGLGSALLDAGLAWAADAGAHKAGLSLIHI